MIFNIEVFERIFKQCKKCNRILPKLEFWKNKRMKDGLQIWCKECLGVYNKPYCARFNRSEKGRGFRKKYLKKYLKEHPWLKAYNRARLRCNYPKHDNYPSYGGKGVELRMKPKGFEFLWNRDKAYLMNHPSIDRINTTDPEKWHYALENCRFIEWFQNRGRSSRKPS